MPLFLLPLCAAYCLPLLLLLKSNGKPHYVWVKALASACFLAVAILCAALGGHTARLLGVLPGLFLCFCGDVVLGLRNRSHSGTHLAVGLALFLAGHIAFYIRMLLIRPLKLGELLLPALLMLVLVGIVHLPKMHMGKMTAAVYVYGAAISLMFAKSLSLAVLLGGVGNWVYCVGAGLLLLSDVIIMFVYFYKDAPPAVHVANLTSYYTGMLLMGVSLYFA